MTPVDSIKSSSFHYELMIGSISTSQLGFDVLHILPPTQSPIRPSECQERPGVAAMFVAFMIYAHCSGRLIAQSKATYQGP